MSTTNTLPNPLLDTTGLPLFDQISAPHVEPAMDILLQQAQAALEAAVSASTPATFDAVSAVLDVANERLGRAWGAVNHLNAVADTPELRAAYNACLPRPLPKHPKQPSSTRRGAPFWSMRFGTSCSAALNCRVRPSSGLPPSRNAWPNCHSASARTCWMPRMASPITPVRPTWPACPRTWCRPHEPPQSRRDAKATRSPCTTRATSR